MKKSLVLFFSIIVFACTDKAKYENIAGEWKCKSWINKKNNLDKCNNNVYFKFNIDKTYLSKIGSVKDSGTYTMAEDRLFTTPKGKMEIGVKIMKLNHDSLELLMNHGGVEEILTLVKK